MPNILDLRRRIRSVKNTQQITRAMKMVAAARLRRAQEQVLGARPYARQMVSLLESLSARAANRTHPLLMERPVRRVLLVLVTADRGLCGAFNSNLIHAAQKYLVENQTKEVLLIAAGRKGRDFFRRHSVNMPAEYVNIFSRRVELSHARELAEKVIGLYSSKAVDAVDFIYNEFKSILTQRLVVERRLPVKPLIPPAAENLVDYIYEETPEEIFNHLLPRYVEAEIYRALLESQAAEFAAKMTAMDAATRNAGELIDQYTLNLNRVRQAKITTEIIEIVSGAAAAS